MHLHAQINAIVIIIIMEDALFFLEVIVAVL